MKKYFLTSLLWATACVLLWPLNAQSNQLTLSFFQTRFQFREFNETGNAIIEENGNLPGIRLGWKTSSSSWRQQLYLAHFSGLVIYNGVTQTGLGHRTQTHQSISDLGAVWSYPVDLTAKWEVAPGVGLGYYFWRRNIESRGQVAGLLEKYDWAYVQAVIRGRYQYREHIHWETTANVAMAHNPNMHVEFHDSSESWVTMGAGDGYAVTTALRYRVNDGVFVRLSLSHQRWHFKKSDAYPVTLSNNVVGSVYEPRNTTVQNVVHFSIGFRI